MRVDSINEYMGPEATEIIDMVRKGVPAHVVDSLGRAMEVPRTQLVSWMGRSVATVDRKIRDRSTLSKSAGEQLLLMVRLISQVQRMIHESGDPEGFDAAVWLARWLREPNLSLGSVSPGGYLDTAEGFNLLSDTLARMRSGVYV